jgi:hypothetical protein
MKRYTEDEIVTAFLIAQHADFSRRQIESMVRDAKRDGRSRDFGDGYMIYFDDETESFTATVDRRYI